MKKTLLLPLVSLVAILLVPLSALSQPTKPFTWAVLGSSQQEALARKVRAALSGDELKPTTFSIRIYDQGVVRLALQSALVIENKVSIEGLDSQSEQQQRSVRIGGEITLRAPKQGGVVAPVSGTYFESPTGSRLNLYFSLKNARGKIRFYRLRADFDGSGKIEQLVTGRAPSAALRGLGCNVAHATVSGGYTSTNNSIASPATAKALSGTPVLELNADSDRLFYDIHGGDTSGEITSILDAVSTIYNDQFGLPFTVVGIKVRTTSGPYPSNITDEEELLSTFRSASLENQSTPAADVHHLFTGRDINGDVVGIAYLTAVCNDPSYSYGLSQYVNSALAPIVTAHEIGHNFGANHTETGIMTASLGDPLPDSFSEESVTEIGGHIADYGESCLYNSTQGGVGAPELRVSINRNGRFNARITLAELTEGCSIVLRAAKSKSKALTGTAIFSVVPSQLTIVARTPLRRRVAPRSTRVYFVAEQVCTDQASSYSTAKYVVPGEASGISGKSLTARGWISYLAKLFESA